MHDALTTAVYQLSCGHTTTADVQGLNMIAFKEAMHTEEHARLAFLRDFFGDSWGENLSDPMTEIVIPAEEWLHCQERMVFLNDDPFEDGVHPSYARSFSLQLGSV